MKVKAKKLASQLGRTLACVLPIAGFASCELVREDLAPCPSPVVELRFVYDYNMEYANAFHKQVDCLSVCFFDEAGELVTVETVTDRDVLAEESYRMRPQLDEGSYHVVAYGGMVCDNASFAHPAPLKPGDLLADLRVQLDPGALTDAERARLHNHFYGAADLTVTPDGDSFATVEMMRNTNSIQVALQHTNGAPIDCDDFVFEVLDDNSCFDSENNLIPAGEITYIPYNTENRSTGTVDAPATASRADADNEWHAALAQFATSRLVLRSAAKPTATRLRVSRAEDGEEVLEIPLTNYMLLFKNDSPAALGYMGNQEYLDREHSWNFVFFLDENSGEWIKTRIVVNDWEVRMNDTNF